MGNCKLVRRYDGISDIGYILRNRKHKIHIHFILNINYSVRIHLRFMPQSITHKYFKINCTNYKSHRMICAHLQTLININ